MSPFTYSSPAKYIKNMWMVRSPLPGQVLRGAVAALGLDGLAKRRPSLRLSQTVPFSGVAAARTGCRFQPRPGRPFQRHGIRMVKHEVLWLIINFRLPKNRDPLRCRDENDAGMNSYLSIEETAEREMSNPRECLLNCGHSNTLFRNFLLIAATEVVSPNLRIRARNSGSSVGC